MSLKLAFPLPKLGTRFVIPTYHGCADALSLAQAALTLKKDSRMLAVFVAVPSDAQRLHSEITWFGELLGIPLNCHVLPDWETLPYDHFSPNQDLVSERLESLHEIRQGKCDVLLASCTSALTVMPPPTYLAAYTFFFRQAENLDLEQLRSQLRLAGYSAVSQVMSPGEYAVRGGIIDLFPMGSALPYRLDLLDDNIETIRAFDADTQRSLYPVSEVRILPGHEFPMDETGRTLFRKKWREQFEGDPSRCPIYKDIGNAIAPAGIEYYLPLFFDTTSTLFDYLPIDCMLAMVGDIESSIRNFHEDTQARYRFLKSVPERPILPPEKLFLNDVDFFTCSKSRARWIFPRKAVATESTWSAPIPDVAINRRLDDPLTNLRSWLLQNNNRVLICAESNGRRETLLQIFHEHDLHPVLCDKATDFFSHSVQLMLGVAPLQSGFVATSAQVAFVTENELFAGTTRRASPKRQQDDSQADAILRNLSELKAGDPVVHSQHGIGRYRGLISMDMGEGDTEFLQIEYADESQLYVPVSQLHTISRYSGLTPESAPLHILGSGHWDKIKRKAAQQAHDAAAELLNLYARRALRQGHSFEYNANDYERFADSFGFEETPDQQGAISAVLHDMTHSKPMDRLVCGDVGFGKTEVALRAAFIAVMGGKQVAILAPTTLLAEQHAQTFSDRFAEWPVRIGELSRFRTGREITHAIKDITNGTLDIVIGTHKLLSKDVKFNRLGLIIIDEEHRFGVRQKEALKALRSEVDVLTLTATPIPRTLGMALDGLRDISVIATAPQKRLAIKTFVRSESQDIIKEACLRELKRGGQVYFLHNEVETIQNRKKSLEGLLPEARIGVAHGQMHERELERVMRDFVAQRFNILLCTTIIETGIDVPSANTIIMHRADRFGLAQLHQLRGRVGRSHHQAYAYLLVHDVEGLTQQAVKRLEAIKQMEELGSGFYLAMHDLEIRGAGEILGDKQSGEITEIGFQLYSDMLNEAIRSLKSGKEPDLAAPLPSTTEINLHVPALLPTEYCPDVHVRLSIYKRMASCSNADELDVIHEELIDRFGKLPNPASALLETHYLRILAKEIGIQKIDAHSESALLCFIPNPPIDSLKIINLIQNNLHIKLNGQDKLRIAASMPDLNSRTSQLKNTIRALQS